MRIILSLSILVFSASVFAQNLDCSTSAVKGFVEAPLVPQFSAEQIKNNSRITEIWSKLSQTQINDKRTYKVFYELATPFDPKKESIFMSGGFYPWLNLETAKTTYGFLSQQYNVFEIHMRGSGCSVTPNDLSPLLYVHEFVAADLEAVRKQLGIAKLNAWGSSNGSWVVLMYAVLYPSTVDKLLLRDTSLYAPGLQEVASNFEVQLLPELIGPERTEKLAKMKKDNEQVYDALLRFVGTFLIRNEVQRQNIAGLVDEVSTNLESKDLNVVKSIKETVIDLANSPVTDWAPATLYNECAQQEIYKNANANKMYVVSYVYPRCSEFQKNNPGAVISDINFTGRLGHLKNKFFIYNGYWDDITTRDSAVALSKELSNSYLYIDKNIGHGEINQASYECFGYILSGFFGGYAPVGYMGKCK